MTHGELGHVDEAIPAQSLATISQIEDNGRLYGEIAYYRVWAKNTNEEKPSTDVKSDLNTIYYGEIGYVPRGCEDLYILDNHKMGIKKNKTYIIDASNSMIYSLNGYDVDGYDVHSLAMYRQMQNSQTDYIPTFAIGEVVGAGNDIVYAGSKYYMNKDGKYVDKKGNVVSEDKKVLNEDGFEIIASNYSGNIYKLYNNGLLYAKGAKGIQLNTSTTEMASLGSNVFAKIEIPAEIGAYKKVFVGRGTIYVLDSKNVLWAWGNNSDNKLGLNQEELESYTERDPIKVGLPDGIIAEKVFDLGHILFIVSTNDKLYGMGANGTYYYLGIGHANQVFEFQEITLPNSQSPKEIEYFESFCEDRYGIIMACSDGHFYATGGVAELLSGFKWRGGNIKKWTPILDGYAYKLDENGNVVKNEDVTYEPSADFDGNIQKIVGADAQGAAVLDKSGNLYHLGHLHYNYFAGYNTNTTGNHIQAVSSTLPYATGVRDIQKFGSCGLMVIMNNGDVYARAGLSNAAGTDTGSTTATLLKITMPTLSSDETIQEVQAFGYGMYVLTSKGKLYGIGTDKNSFGLATVPGSMTLCSNAPSISSLSLWGDNWVNAGYTLHGFSGGTFKCSDGVYTINYSSVTFRNDIIQTQWSIINPKDTNGDYISISKVAIGPNSCIGLVDNTKNLWVAGSDGNLLLQGNANTVNNFSLLDNDLINDKVKDVFFKVNQMYVLTDLGNLYCVGYYKTGR